MTDRWRYQCPDGHVTVTTRETLGVYYCGTYKQRYPKKRDAKTGRWVRP